MPKPHIKLPKHKAMDQHYKAKWRQAEADLQALCQSNSAQAQSLASKLQETNPEHQQLYTAQERQLQLEAQALRQAQNEEQQASAIAHERELAVAEAQAATGGAPHRGLLHEYMATGLGKPCRGEYFELRDGPS